LQSAGVGSIFSTKFHSCHCQQVIAAGCPSTARAAIYSGPGNRSYNDQLEMFWDSSLVHRIAADSPGVTETSNCFKSSERPKPLALTYASLRVQQEKKATCCNSLGIASNSRVSAGEKKRLANCSHGTLLSRYSISIPML